MSAVLICAALFALAILCVGVDHAADREERRRQDAAWRQVAELARRRGRK